MLRWSTRPKARINKAKALLEEDKYEKVEGKEKKIQKDENRSGKRRNIQTVPKMISVKCV